MAILKGFAAVDAKALWKEKQRVHEWVPTMVEMLVLLMAGNSEQELGVQSVVLKVDLWEPVPMVAQMAAQKVLIVDAEKEISQAVNWASTMAVQLADEKVDLMDIQLAADWVTGSAAQTVHFSVGWWEMLSGK